MASEVKFLETLDVRGSLRQNADLSKTNWFRVGGAAEWLFKPADVEDLARFIRQKPVNIPMTVLGVGSNLIVRDGGIDGVVVKLGRGFTECKVIDSARSEVTTQSRAVNSEQEVLDRRVEVNTSPREDVLSIGAGCLDLNVALWFADNGIAGLEFLSGIPGTIGGALRMNAGAYGREIKDVLIAAEVVTGEGEIKAVGVDELGYSYRHSDAPKDWIFTKAYLRANQGESETIYARIAEIKAQREESQPVRERTGGSTFRNPSDQTEKKAWQVIDEAGCRGLQMGGAQMSEKHCNFMINTGNATAHDLEALGEEVRARVKAHSGVELEWEIQRIGKP